MDNHTEKLLRELITLFDTIRAPSYMHPNAIDARGFYRPVIHVSELEPIRLACLELGLELHYIRSNADATITDTEVNDGTV